LLVFNEPATGFSTSDLYDAHDRIVQFTKSGDLVWMADGTHLPGFSLRPDSASWPPPTYLILSPTPTTDGCEGPPCVFSFSVRFGARDGVRRAYLTIDYDLYNPGTLVDVEVVNGELVVTRTSAYAPGTPTLSGVVTESTPDGPVPVVGAHVSRQVPTGGWQGTTTDGNGFYELRGLIAGTASVSAGLPGYRGKSQNVTVNGDMRLDFQLVRQ
jgi:hypothetical protein